MVRNIFDLFVHITLHRRRVYALADACKASWELSAYARLYLLMHDIEKYLFLPVLWHYYGGKGNRVRARKWYDFMNQVGKVLVFPFFAPAWLKSLEKVADVVDRHCDPVAIEEFARKQEIPITDFLKEEDEINLAYSLISLYDRITAGLYY